MITLRWWVYGLLCLLAATLGIWCGEIDGRRETQTAVAAAVKHIILNQQLRDEAGPQLCCAPGQKDEGQ